MTGVKRPLCPQVLSIGYSLLMVVILVGIVIHIFTDGWFTPGSISFTATASIFVLAAILHPQEFWCLPMGIIYYLTIPSMQVSFGNAPRETRSLVKQLGAFGDNFKANMFSFDIFLLL